MSVKSVTVYSERPWHGNVKRRYEVTLTDITGQDHTQVVGVVTVPESDDGSEIAVKLLASKKQGEIEQYKEAIRDGVNPFDGVELWNTRPELLKPILDAALSLPATDALVYNGLPYLEFVTDEELMVLYQQDQAWVDNVRLQASSLLQGKAALDNYVSVLP